MDVDCDGNPVSTGGDTRCDSSQDTIPETAFKSMVQQYGISDLNAYIHTYVVFGNQGTKQGFVNFKPQDYGMEPLSVMAVVCGNQMVSLLRQLYETDLFEEIDWRYNSSTVFGAMSTVMTGPKQQ